MTLNTTRREILRVAAGSAAGLLLTPVPWKVADDLAIWTQNWGWIPRPPEGKLTTSVTVCSLCPHACGVRVRCVGGLPVSVGPTAGQTARGGLCPLGLSGHHLRYHPCRITHPVRLIHDGGQIRALPVQLEAVLAAIAAAHRGGSVAVLDQRPGRVVSWAWRRMLAEAPGNAYVPAPNRTDASVVTLRRMLGEPDGAYGLEVTAASTVLSFGQPLVEVPGALRRGERRPMLIQVEPRQSPTALAADRWLPARPGSEGALALALAHVLLAEHLVDMAAARRHVSDLENYLALVADFTPEVGAAMTGLGPQTILATARALGAGRPAVAIPGNDPGGGPLDRGAQTAIWGLDLLLGGVSGDGPVVRRADLPQPEGVGDGGLVPEVELDAVPDRSIAVLLLDAASGDAPFPWGLLRRKLAGRGAVVVCLSPFLAGSAVYADFVVPTPAFLEAYADLPTAPLAPVAALAVSAPPAKPPVGVADPIAFMRSAAVALGVPAGCGWRSGGEAVRARVESVFRQGRGTVTSPAGEDARPLAQIGDVEAFWSALQAGARWRDSAVASSEPGTFALLGGLEERFNQLVHREARLRGGDPAWPLTLLVFGSGDVTSSAAVSPLFGKLYRESGLRRRPGEAALHPETGIACGLKAGRRAKLSTPAGWTVVTVVFDGAVMPGVVEVATAPTTRALGEAGRSWGRDVLDLCEPGTGACWREAKARLVEA